MTKARKYSLWLMPSRDIYNQLAKVISRLSKKHSTASFEPHVTLLGGLTEPEEEILSKTYQLSTLVQPYVIHLTTIDYLDEYFKCLFIRVKETKSVLEVNVKATEVFSQQQDLKYMPHLSLMYGNLSFEAKEEIIEEIVEINFRFEVRSIHLFSTNGEPENWYRVQEFPLGN